MASGLPVSDALLLQRSRSEHRGGMVRFRLPQISGPPHRYHHVCPPPERRLALGKRNSGSSSTLRRGALTCSASASSSKSGTVWSLRSSDSLGGSDESEDLLSKPAEQQQQKQKQFLEFPKQIARQILRYDDNIPDPPKVKVRLSVRYECFNRQMLCIGGSNIPFGWSFLSIAKVPMSWTDNHIWTAEVEVPLGTRLEYKYVILEEQDWTKQENQNAEGVVTTFRVSPGEVPDVQSITKKMAIVAWQPGPNRVLVVPKEEEFAGMVPGEVKERQPGPSRQDRSFQTGSGTSARNDVVFGHEEAIMLQSDNTPVLIRKDVWDYGDWVSRQPKGPPNPPSRFGS